MYGKIKVLLTREYKDIDAPTVQALVRGVEKTVTVLTVQEFTGQDDENIQKQDNPTIYTEIAVCCGLTDQEAKSLSRGDATLISKAMQSFLYESEEIVEIDSKPTA